MSLRRRHAASLARLLYTRLSASRRLRLFLDAQKHPGTTRQLELALFGGQDNDAGGLALSSMRDANLGQTVGATRIRGKNPHGLPTVVITNCRQAISALPIIGVHLSQYALVYGFSDHLTIRCGHLPCRGVGDVATHLRSRNRH